MKGGEEEGCNNPLPFFVFVFRATPLPSMPRVYENKAPDSRRLNAYAAPNTPRMEELPSTKHNGINHESLCQH